jgi:hypothetical protein
MDDVPQKLTITLLVEGFDCRLRHQIHAEVTSEFMGGKCRVRGAVVEMDKEFIGDGDTQLGAILDMLGNVNRSIAYVPAYRKL